MATATANPDKLYGYNTKDIQQFFKVTPTEASAFIHYQNGGTLSTTEQSALGNFDLGKLSSALSALKKTPKTGPTGETFAGFSYRDIQDYLGISATEASGLIKLYNNQKPSWYENFVLSRSIPVWAKQKASSPLGGSNTWEIIQRGFQHLGEHPAGSHYHGDFNISFSSFNIGKMFDRFFTIRPQSFTPGNLSRDLSSGTTTVLTGGLIDKVSVANVPVISTSAHDTSVISAAYVGANSFGTTQAGNPADKESLINRISRIFGGVISSVAGGKAVANYFTNPGTGSQGVESGVAGTGAKAGIPPTGFQTVGNYTASAVSASSQAYAVSGVANVVISVFGQKFGGALLALFSGDVAGAFKLATSNTPGGPGNIPTGSNPSSGGGGFGGGGAGGGGFLPSQNAGQITSNGLLFPIMGISILLVIVWWMRRK